MSGSLDIDPRRFVTAVEPLLEARNIEALVCYLKSNYTAEQITSLLASKSPDARKVAALALALVGHKCCIPALAARLADPDPLTNQMAEHALWSIWFRCGSAAANSELAAGTECLSDRNFDCAFEHFGRALKLCPEFAEAYNQRAIAWYMLEEYDKCAEDCRKAVELMPCHFGAWAGLGHCHAHYGRLAEATQCYEKALEVNPHLECIRQAIEEMRKQRDRS